MPFCPPWIPLGLRAALLASSAALAACEGALAERPRHLILVTIDALRADHLSTYGYARGTTSTLESGRRGSVPGFTIDDLAAQGTLFTRAFAPRGETFPSIATLFTGRPPIETCVLDNLDTLPASARTLAECLQDAGFATAAFTSNRLLVPGSGIEQGFDHFETDASPERDERMVQAAERWLAGRDLEAGPPVFVWIHLVGPHLPYVPRPLDGIAFADLYAPAGYAGPANGSRELTDLAHAGEVELDPADVEAQIALYDGEVARIDHILSGFLSFCSGQSASQPLDLLSRSLLVFTADHGEELFERHRHFGHSKSVYGSVLHVPLVLRHPASLSASRRIEDVVALEDLAPTILDLFRMKNEPAMHGVSLAHALRGGRADPRTAFGLWADRIFTARSDRWRLVWNPDRLEPTDRPKGSYPIPEIALYDLSADPAETRDVAQDHPDVVLELQRSIRAWEAGLTRCAHASEALTPERIRALEEMGYAGADR